MTDPILKVEGLTKHYEIRLFLRPPKIVRAVEDVSFEIEKGKALGLVGESGCGKTTIGKLLVQIEPVTQGKILLNGISCERIDRKKYCQDIQMIFQDPYGSLNPRKRAVDIISEPLIINTNITPNERLEKVRNIMERVGLRPEYMHRYPHMFSGGQRQRIGIARALILNPKIVICDEPVSSLDVSVQAQAINLLIELQETLNLSYLFISHDLAVVKHISDHVLVMYLGRVMEYGARNEIFENPLHPYTQALLASTPKLHSKDQTKHELVKGELPSPLNPPTGCPFHKRCPHAMPHCKTTMPPLKVVQNRKVACHLYDNL